MVTIIVSVVIAFVSLVTAFVLGGVFADIAIDKGYDWYKAFWLCFFLGYIGYIYVIARPDKRIREKAKYLEDSKVCNKI